MSAKNKIFEKTLLETINAKKIRFSKNLDFEFSDTQLSIIDKTITAAIQYREIKEKILSINKNKSLASYLLSVREKTKLSPEKLANILNIESNLYNSIETGRIGLKSISVDSLVKILITCNIRLTEFIEMIKKEISLSSINTSQVKAIARTSHKSISDDRNQNLILGIDAALLEISKKDKNENIDISNYDSLIKDLEKRIKQENELHLLT